MTELDVRLTRYRTLLERGLNGLLAGRPPFQNLYGMMAYHLGRLDENLKPTTAGAGKSLRPALCFSACESVGGGTTAAIPGALAVELLHNFSLVHDDIQDGSPFRRHRAAVWTIWGVPHAINVGDGLFALAHLALARGELKEEIRSRVERIFSRACIELCEGQFLDMGFQRSMEVSLDEYSLMAQKKTAALFGCAAEIGALMGGASEVVARRLGDFGRLVGEAFQVCDDILGVWGDERVTGKPARDVHDRKRGLPAVLALVRAEGADLVRLSTLYASNEPLSEDAVAWVTALFDRLEVRRETISHADELFRSAEAKLAGQVAGSATALRELVSLVPRPWASQSGRAVRT